MAAFPSRERIAFLYRTDQGRIGRATWAKGAGCLAAILAPLTLVWLALKPYAAHDLAKTPFFAPETIAAYAYVMFYAFAVFLIAISFVNLSAKRFRDRGYKAPLFLGALLPLAAFLVAAAHFLQPRVVEVMSHWYATAGDVALVGVAAWSLYELGLRD